MEIIENKETDKKRKTTKYISQNMENDKRSIMTS
jgi:hypothetical protein